MWLVAITCECVAVVTTRIIRLTTAPARITATAAAAAAARDITH
jgi:hypothetical protein